MSRQYHNIFHYYRGPRESASDYEQIENNLTKALVNTLELSSAEVANAFLRWLGVRNPPPFQKLRFDLQRATPSRPVYQGLHGILLCIAGSADGEPEAAAVTSRSDASPPRRDIPDAWVYGTRLVVGIEAKLRQPDEEQLQRYQEKLEYLTGARPVLKRVSWKEVSDHFRASLMRGGNTVDGLLIRQFVKELEMIGQASFTGFEAMHFDFDPADREDWGWIRGVLTRLADDVRSRAGLGDWKTWLPGRLSPARTRYAWVGIGPEAPSVGAKPHITLALTPGEVEIYASFNTAQAMRPLRWLLKAEPAGTYGELLNLAKKGFTLRLGAKEHLGPHQDEWHFVADLALHMAAIDPGDGPRLLEDLLACHKNPVVEVRKTLARHEAMQLGDRALDEVANACRDLLPLIQQALELWK